MTKSPIGETSEIELLKKQLEELQNAVKILTASKQEEPKPKKERTVRLAKQEKSRELNPNTLVDVMSLCGNPLNLSTSKKDPKDTFRFEKLGDMKKLMYSQLLRVIENHPNFFENGFFYVMNEDIVKANNWTELYSKLLTKENIEAVINNSQNAIELFEKAGEKQREVILNIIIEKMSNGESIDFNFIAKLNKIENIDINKMAQDRKEANQPQSQNENK